MPRPALSLAFSNPEVTPSRSQASLRVVGVASDCGHVATPEAVKDNLALLWGRFCLANFADSRDCAQTFRCTRQCADNWFESDRHRPSGQHVVYAIDLFGPALAAYLAGPVDAPAPRLRTLVGIAAPQLRRVA